MREHTEGRDDDGGDEEQVEKEQVHSLDELHSDDGWIVQVGQINDAGYHVE